MRPQVKPGIGLGVVAAVVLVLVGLGVAAGRAASDHTEPPPSATAAVHTTKALVGATLLRVAGSGNRLAGRFIASGPWQLNWTVDCGNELGRMFIVDLQPLGKPASSRQVALPGAFQQDYSVPPIPWTTRGSERSELAGRYKVTVVAFVRPDSLRAKPCPWTIQVSS